MDQQQLREAVESFDVWHYQFDLDGVTTPIYRPDNVNRHRQRRAYFFDPLVQLLGGSLRGKRVLDLGCNAGYWSLLAVEHGADFVLGVDGRQMHVDQANLVFDAKGVAPERYRFERGNVFDHDYATHGPFDVLLCLGLLYHVSKPVQLFELMAGTGTELIVVDTNVTLGRGAHFTMRREATGSPRSTIDYQTVLTPSRRAVVQLAEQFGYEAVVLRPSVEDATRMLDYVDGRRRAFICAKGVDLARLPADAAEPPRWASRRYALTRKVRVKRRRPTF